MFMGEKFFFLNVMLCDIPQKITIRTIWYQSMMDSIDQTPY